MIKTFQPFKHAPPYYTVTFNSDEQLFFYNFIMILNGNKLTRSNKLTWNKLKPVRQLHQIGTKWQIWHSCLVMVIIIMMSSFFFAVLSRYLEGNKVARIIKITWKKLQLVRRPYQIGTKVQTSFHHTKTHCRDHTENV